MSDAHRHQGALRVGTTRGTTKIEEPPRQLRYLSALDPIAVDHPRGERPSSRHNHRRPAAGDDLDRHVPLVVDAKRHRRPPGPFPPAATPPPATITRPTGGQRRQPGPPHPPRHPTPPSPHAPLTSDDTLRVPRRPQTTV